MKILLIAPYFQDDNYPLYLPSENLGIAYIASLLRQYQYDVDIKDLNMNRIKAEDSFLHIDYNEYNVVGISVCFQLLHAESIILSNTIKRINKHAKVILGGHYPTFAYKEIFKECANIDIIVRGDGEYTFLELVKCINEDNGYDNVLGVSFLKENEIYSTANRPLLRDLDILPWPSRDTLHEITNKYNHAWPTQITTSRGCFCHCNFCGIRAFYNSVWRGRDAKDVVDEIEYLNHKFGSYVFRLSDDEFFGKGIKCKERTVKIAEEILKRNLKIQLMISARATDVDEELFKFLKLAGMNSCLIGIESGVDRILKLYNKHCSVDENINAIQILKKLGITLNLAFIMFDPRMTFEELRVNYFFLKNNQIMNAEALKSNLWILRGSQLETDFLNDNLLYGNRYNPFYEFADSQVGEFYKIVQALKRETYNIEKYIFNIRINKKLTEVNVNLIERYEKTWISVFENRLERNNKLDSKTVFEEFESIYINFKEEDLK